MLSGLSLVVVIILCILCFIIGVAAVAQSNPGPGLFCILFSIMLFIVMIVPECHSKKSTPKIAGSSLTPEVKVECGDSKLCNKLGDLAELRQKLAAKKEEINKLIKEYSASINQLEDELRAEKRNKRINSYAEAKVNQRISYDLALIQRKGAYISKLEEVLSKLDSGANELEFLQRQTEDDIKMEKVLGEKEIEKLAEKIEETIAKYLPEAGELVISVDESKMESPQQIWQRIAGGG